MTLADLLALLERRAQEAEVIGATAPLAQVYRQVIEELRELDGTPAQTTGSPAVDPLSSFWVCPPETRIMGVQALAVATGLTTAWLYRRTRRIPHARLDGVLLFEVGAVRQWLLEQAVQVRPRAVVVRRRRQSITNQ